MYLKKIKVNELRNLNGVDVELSSKKKNLIITGANGAGKTTFLDGLYNYMITEVASKKFLLAQNNKEQLENYTFLIEELEKVSRNLQQENEYNSHKKVKEYLSKEVENNEIFDLEFEDISEICNLIANERFLILKFQAKRNIIMEVSQGVQNINLDEIRSDYQYKGNSQKLFLKYMVHLKTQLAYAISDGEEVVKKEIENWFDRFLNLLKTIFENDNLKLIYDRQNYNFKIDDGEKQFDFNTLSDGFSSLIDIITGLMFSMEKENISECNYDLSGIVFIDEIETHLHVSLQKIILKVLTDFFPNIQFIVTTHSPFVLSSIDSAVVYDLKNRIAIDDLYKYSYDSIVENYFDADRYSKKIKENFIKYKALKELKNKTEEQKKEFTNLYIELKNINSEMAKELYLEFKRIEGEA